MPAAYLDCNGVEASLNSARWKSDPYNLGFSAINFQKWRA